MRNHAVFLGTDFFCHQDGKSLDVRPAIPIDTLISLRSEINSLRSGHAAAVVLADGLRSTAVDCSCHGATPDEDRSGDAGQADAKVSAVGDELSRGENAAKRGKRVEHPGHVADGIDAGRSGARWPGVQVIAGIVLALTGCIPDDRPAPVRAGHCAVLRYEGSAAIVQRCAYDGSSWWCSGNRCERGEALGIEAKVGAR